MVKTDIDPLDFVHYFLHPHKKETYIIVALDIRAEEELALVNGFHLFKADAFGREHMLCRGFSFWRFWILLAYIFIYPRIGFVSGNGI